MLLVEVTEVGVTEGRVPLFVPGMTKLFGYGMVILFWKGVAITNNTYLVLRSNPSGDAGLTRASGGLV